MRTNIELNDQLVEEARRYSSARTKRALIEEALRTFIEVESERRRSASYAARVREVQGRLSGLALRESPSQVLRQDRSR